MEIKEEFKTYMKEIVRALPATLFFKDTEGRYVFTTQVCDLVNAGPDGSILGKRETEVQRDKALGKRYYEEDMRILKTGESTHTIDAIHIEGQETVYIEVMKEAIRNDEGEIIGICGICNHMTELENLRKKYQELSLCDPMTGAYNRNYTFECDFDREECLPCSYIFCDCNNLKKINDNYGHDMGDKYIMEAFHILKECMKSQSTIIRWGGDEFLVITPNCGGKEHEELLQEMETAQQKLSELKPGMGLAIGGMVRETMEIPESVVMKQADQKMYENKKSSR